MLSSPNEFPPTIRVFNTSLVPTNYKALREWVYAHPREVPPKTIDFTNTHIVTMRAIDAAFDAATSTIDFFVPDGTPVVWVINALGGKLKDRVYGPRFTAECLATSTSTIKHYFIGGTDACVENLKKNLLNKNPSLNIVGMRSGYFSDSDEAAIMAEIVEAAPDCVWVGLGTPKQQIFASKLKPKLSSGIIVLVGFAFDVNAGTKPDAPMFLQRLGMTWLFRAVTEPTRLIPRYVKWNSLFLLLLGNHILDKAIAMLFGRAVGITTWAYLLLLTTTTMFAPSQAAQILIFVGSTLTACISYTAAVATPWMQDVLGPHRRLALIMFDVASSSAALIALASPIVLTAWNWLALIR